MPQPNFLAAGITPSGRYERVSALEVNNPQTFKIPPGGLLHEVIIGFDPPLANTDASNPYFVEVSVRGRYSEPVTPTYVHSRIESLNVQES